jgi:glycosyltransferase involved in cell wall biosynthesis
LVISHPPSSQFLNRDFVDFLTIGIPVEAAAATQADRSGRLRVLHAPSHAGAKGTAVIREAIASCIEAGVDIEYVELSGKSNREVLAAFATTDVAVDQAFSDQPMAGFATEASAYGIPVVVGSCDWEAALHSIADPPPTVRCSPDEIGETVAKLAADPDLRKHAAKAARDYVVSRLAPAAVATRYLKLIEDETPADWLRSPRDITYAWGVGLSRDRVREVVAAIVREHGEDALLLSDRPVVREQLLARES